MKCIKCGNEINNNECMCQVCGYTNNSVTNSQLNTIAINNKKRKNKLIICIISIITLSISGFLISNFLLADKSDINDKENNEDNIVIEVESENLKNKVSTNYEILKNGDYLFIIKNGSDNILNFDCTAERYSGSKVSFTERIGMASDTYPSGNSYAVLHKSSVEAAKSNKIVVKINPKVSRYKEYGNMIKHSEEKMDDRLLVHLTNNSNVELQYIFVEIIYYDENNKIVAYDASSTLDKVTIGSTNTVKFFYPKDANKNLISFSRYEFKITTM